MTVRFVQHDDVGAGTLTGQVGSLVSILDTELVAAGWTIAFSSTNKRAYRNSPGSGSGCYLRVDDTGPGTGSAREASLQVYATMSDIDTGTDGTGELWIRKSSTLDATARAWSIAADNQTAIIYVHDAGDGTERARGASLIYAGDYSCLDTSNAFRYCLIGRTNQNNTSGGEQSAFWSTTLQRSGFRTVHPDGVTGAISAGVKNCPYPSSTTSIGNAGSTMPDPAWLSDAHLAPVIFGGGLSDGTFGRLRGLYQPVHRMWPAFGIAQDLGSGLLFAPMQASQSTSQDTRVGAGIIDTAGPW